MTADQLPGRGPMPFGGMTSFEVGDSIALLQTVMEGDRLRERVDTIFDGVLAQIPSGATEVELRFEDRGSLKVQNDGRSDPKLTGHFIERDRLHSTFFEITGASLRRPDGSIYVRRFPIPGGSPDKYRDSVEADRFATLAIEQLFSGYIGGPDEYDGLSTIRVAFAPQIRPDENPMA